METLRKTGQPRTRIFLEEFSLLGDQIGGKEDRPTSPRCRRPSGERLEETLIYKGGKIEKGGASLSSEASPRQRPTARSL